MLRTHDLSGWLALWLSISSFLGAGCSTLTRTPVPAAPGAPSPATFSIEVRPAGRSPKRKQVVLEKDLHLQDAVKMSGAHFRKKDIYIVRKSPKTGTRHKLGTTIDSQRRQISLETDYAILPGDVVVVAEDTSTVFDEILQGVLRR
jgi:hypothetical protein